MLTTAPKSQEYNLGVLKKHDPCISRVLHTAGHAVVYVYNEESTESPWERHNVEGALFIVERAAEPRYQLLILNRLSTSNLVENITSDFSIEVTEEVRAARARQMYLRTCADVSTCSLACISLA
jgi:hypothetical protein